MFTLLRRGTMYRSLVYQDCTRHDLKKTSKMKQEEKQDPSKKEKANKQDDTQ